MVYKKWHRVDTHISTYVWLDPRTIHGYRLQNFSKIAVFVFAMNLCHVVSNGMAVSFRGVIVHRLGRKHLTSVFMTEFRWNKIAFVWDVNNNRPETSRKHQKM